MRDEIQRLAQQYQFFHWHLAFPHVFRVPNEDEGPENEATGWSGGFHTLLGNPPWEHTELKEKEFFAGTRPEIAEARTGAIRKRRIALLEKEAPDLFAEFVAAKRASDCTAHLIQDSGRYPMCGRGRTNTYGIFTELNRCLIAACGRVGCIVPSGIATDDTYKHFFRDIVANDLLASFYDFENQGIFFPDVHRNYKFCLLTLAGPASNKGYGANFLFFGNSPADVFDPTLTFTLTPQDIALFCPNTSTCPIFRTRRDATLAKTAYSRIGVFVNESQEDGNPWKVSITRVFNMGVPEVVDQCVREFDQSSSQALLRMYESKLMWGYDHRHATYANTGGVAKAKGNPRTPAIGEKADPSFITAPRFWIPTTAFKGAAADHIKTTRWLVCFRDVTRAVDQRTISACALPVVATDLTLRLMFFNAEWKGLASCLLANLNAFVFDYFARQKIGGIHMSDFITKQLPAVPPRAYDEVFIDQQTTSALVSERVLELTYTAWDLESFAKDCGYNGAPFRWDEDRRFLLRCELDAAYFHLYGIEREDVDYMMETFPIVKRKDEKQHGEYRTKRVILEIYDAMQKAIDTGQPYQTLLDPPPGPPPEGLPDWQPGQPKPATWPPHIHPPRHASGTATTESPAPQSPPTPAAPATWQMTRGQYQEYCKSQGRNDVTENNRLYWREVEAAIQSGKPVPPEVRGEFRQLKG